tara:strand:- start:380 stop:514 length:135 start_codon:yes stop_codon:yes gene_type:complete
MIIAKDISQAQVFYQDDNTINVISSKDSVIKKTSNDQNNHWLIA